MEFDGELTKKLKCMQYKKTKKNRRETNSSRRLVSQVILLALQNLHA